MSSPSRDDRARSAAVANEIELPDVTEPRLSTVDVGRNVLLAIVANVLTPFAALLTTPLLAHALGVEGRGALAAGTAPLLLATAVGTFGIPDAVTFAVARSPVVLRTALRRGTTLIIGSGTLATFGAVFASGLLSGENSSIAHLIVLGSLATAPTLALAVLRAGAAGLQMWKHILAEQVISAGTRLILLVAYDLGGHLTATSAVLIMAFTPVIAGLVYLPVLRRMTPKLATLPVAGWAELVSFGGRIWLGSLSGFVLARLDQLIMTPISGAEQLGLYAVAVSVSEVALIVSNAVRDVSFSSDAADSDSDRLGLSARLAFSSSFLVAAALLLPLAWWLPAVFGGGFAAAELPCAILLAAAVIGTPGSVAGAGLSARGRPGKRSLSIAIGALVNVVMLVILLPHYGAVGAAWATFGGNFTAGMMNIVWLTRLSGSAASLYLIPRWSDVGRLTGLVGPRLRGGSS